MNMVSPVVVLVIIEFIPFVTSINYTSQVTIDSGKLLGQVITVNNTNGAKVRRYLGIPYAQAERFQPPKAPSKWPDNEVKKMISFGKACPQMIGAFGPKNVSEMDENCLNLNVFVPDDSNSSSALPVMVWIHGGGYVGGSSNIYDGSYLSVLGKVIVVTINYRLSVFGFLTNGKDGDIKGNYGMLDQVEALKWANKNIDKFNGDPNKVTIFGESAGGASVSLLVLSKMTKGLFQRAIQQSGDATCPWAFGTHERLARPIKLFAKLVGCPEDLKKLRECLKPKDTMTILSASFTIPFPTFVPVVDKKFIDDFPRVLYDKQQFEKVEVMTGITNHEGIVFTNSIPGLSAGFNVTNGVSRDAFVQALRGGALNFSIPNPKSVLVNSTIYRYTYWKNVTSLTSNRLMYVDLQGDTSFIAPAVQGAQAYARKKMATYFYLLEYRHEGAFLGLPVPSWVKAHHGADILFVFGFPLLAETTTRSANFTRNVIKLWTNFAKTGNPNSPDSVGITWPQYTMDGQHYLSLKPDMEVHSHVRAEHVAYWNDFIPEALRGEHARKPCDCEPCAGGSIVKVTATMVFLLSTVITWFL